MRTLRGLAGLAFVAAFAAACSAGGGATPSAAAVAAPTAAASVEAPARRPSGRRPVGHAVRARRTPGAQDRRQADDRRRQPRLSAVLRAVRHATPTRGSSATRRTARASRAPSASRSPRRWASPRTRSPGSPASSTTRSRPAPRTSTCTSARSRTAPSEPRPIDISDGYYDLTQSLVVPAKSKFAKATTIADLKDMQLGAQVGTTSLKTITDVVAPSKEPKVYDSNDAAVAALQNGQIDGIVVDLPTASYVAGVQLGDGIIVGQFADSAARRALRRGAGQGQPAHRVRERRDRPAGRGRDPRRARHAVAARPGERPRLPALTRGPGCGPGGGRGGPAPPPAGAPLRAGRRGRSLAGHRGACRPPSCSASSATSSSTPRAGRGSRSRSSTGRSSGSRCPS